MGLTVQQHWVLATYPPNYMNFSNFFYHLGNRNICLSFYFNFVSKLIYYPFVVAEKLGKYCASFLLKELLQRKWLKDL